MGGLSESEFGVYKTEQIMHMPPCWTQGAI